MHSPLPVGDAANALDEMRRRDRRIDFIRRRFEQRKPTIEKRAVNGQIHMPSHRLAMMAADINATDDRNAHSVAIWCCQWMILAANRHCCRVRYCLTAIPRQFAKVEQVRIGSGEHR